LTRPLAYTTVMSAMNRLEAKGVLASRYEKGVRAHKYSAAMEPAGFPDQAGSRQVREVVDKFGEVALAAFEAHLHGLTLDERDRPRKIGGR
jgi:predicted transcriptional regulator